MLGEILGAVTGLGSRWLENRNNKAQAKADLELAKLQAKTALVASEQQALSEARKQYSDMDHTTIEQQAKSLWDEFICLIPLGMLIYAIFDPEGAAATFKVIEALPTWFLVLLGLIYVRYLGFRGLLRYALRIMWDNRPKMKL